MHDDASDKMHVSLLVSLERLHEWAELQANIENVRITKFCSSVSLHFV